MRGRRFALALSLGLLSGPLQADVVNPLPYDRGQPAARPEGSVLRLVLPRRVRMTEGSSALLGGGRAAAGPGG